MKTGTPSSVELVEERSRREESDLSIVSVLWKEVVSHDLLNRLHKTYNKTTKQTPF